MTKTRILLIDDDAELCAEVAELLASEGYQVTHASAPEQGRKLIAGAEFNIALLDYKLHETTGVELLRLIKKKNPKTKVFIVSGRPFMENQLKEEKVFRLVAGVISKPFDCEALLKRIEEAVNAPA